MNLSPVQRAAAFHVMSDFQKTPSLPDAVAWNSTMNVDTENKDTYNTIRLALSNDDTAMDLVPVKGVSQHINSAGQADPAVVSFQGDEHEGEYHSAQLDTTGTGIEQHKYVHFHEGSYDKLVIFAEGQGLKALYTHLPQEPAESQAFMRVYTADEVTAMALGGPVEFQLAGGR